MLAGLRASIFHAQNQILCAGGGQEVVEHGDCLALKLSTKEVNHTKRWAGGQLSQSFFLGKDGPDTECDKKSRSRKEERPDVQGALAQKWQVYYQRQMVAETIS